MIVQDILNLFAASDYVVLYYEHIAQEFFVGSVLDALSNQDYNSMMVCRMIALQSDVIGLEVRKGGA